MSGGYFDYTQFQIEDILSKIKILIDKNEDTSLNEYGEFQYPTFSEGVLNHFKVGYLIIKMATIYIHRMDYLLEDDDGEDSFIERIEEELKPILEELNSMNETLINEEYYKKIIEALQKYTKKITKNAKTARKALIKEGIYTKSGKLHKNYGGEDK